MRLNFFIPCTPPKATSQQKGVRVVKVKPHYFKKKARRGGRKDNDRATVAARAKSATRRPAMSLRRLGLSLAQS